jgi:hypothetical protein
MSTYDVDRFQSLVNGDVARESGPDGQTLLHMACLCDEDRGGFTLSHALLQLRADPNAKCSSLGRRERERERERKREGKK